MSFIEFHHNFPVESACLYFTAGFVLATVILGTLCLWVLDSMNKLLKK